ncbi:nuclear transport factor 2 family protein [Eikenella sp. S3360]|uniref:Nuclear transport factor 2 family protein n=1 Tax=Eikenella glucosivorans TaxID=2766967 RepID=A0ABS0NBC6_9NEIS|nr:nuclear transport factor 2 family protein [Eikenella glucosivorans]MBH5329584.1 nuclear transport factor 2 family protein [Eikenella glucosivorans]
MRLILPTPVAAYFAAADLQAIADCFTANAVVYDENREHRGHAAIRDWHAASAAAVQVVNTPIAATTHGNQTVVTAEVSGNFPGSPIKLQFVFTISGSLIERLEISG